MKRRIGRMRRPLAGLVALTAFLGLSLAAGAPRAAAADVTGVSVRPMTAGAPADQPASAPQDAGRVSDGVPVTGADAGLGRPMGAAPMVAAGAMPQVIWDYPANPGTTKQIALDQMTWNKSGIHSFYDSAYTSTTSKKYNGTATPAHVVLARTAVRFLGYGVNNNLDLVYTTAYSSLETLDFTFNPTLAKFHTLNQSGFLFNGSFTGNNYTGYALVLDATAQAQANQAGTAALKLVYINNQPLNTTGNNTFPNPTGITFATQDTVIGNIVEGKTPAFQVRLVRTATGFDLYIDGNLVREVDPAQGMGLPGFGFFTGYYPHDCAALTVVEYGNVTITVKVLPETTSPMVKFVNKDTGAEIAPAQTVWSNVAAQPNAYVGDEFLVDAASVQTITDTAGKDYAYVGASVTDLNHITYKAGGAANNTIILYYKDPALLPEKHASVEKLADDGTLAAPVAGDGTAGSPVEVKKGDVIDYQIDVKAAGGGATQPIVYGGTDEGNRALGSLTATDTGYQGTTGTTAWTNYTGANAGYPLGTNVVSTGTTLPFIQSIRRVTGPVTATTTYQHYLWLTTKDNLSAGSYTVRITVAADARTWSTAAETGTSGPATTKVFMRGIVGGNSTLNPATYNKPGGYGTFTDQFFPAATGPFTTTATFTALGRITFRSGPSGTLGVNTNDTRALNVTSSNTTPFPTTETSTFQSQLVLGADQPAVIGLVMGGQISGNDISATGEHYTSLIRVLKVEFMPLGPPPAPYDVSDLLPEGISLADDLPNYVTYSSAADPTYTGAGATFTTTQDADTGRQQLRWSFPNLPGDTSIHVKARVTAPTGLFENSALVTNKSAPVVVPDQTNSTWHKAALAMVTEKYVNFLTGETLQPDTYTWVPEGTGYGVAPALRNPVSVGSATYRYYAYLPDDGTAAPLTSAPPDGEPIPDPNGDGSEGAVVKDNLYDQVYGNDRVVTLYFIPDVTVTIISVDDTTVDRATTDRTPLKTWVDYSVPGGVPYVMPVTQMDSFDGYNYVNVYDLNYGSATPGVPAAPVFTATEMRRDNEITLDFAKDPLVTMKFMVDGNETHILSNPLTGVVPYGTDYDPAQSDPPARLKDPITGALYRFVGYRLDSVDSADNTYTSDIGALAPVSSVVANHTYRLLYTLATTTLTVSKAVAGQFGDLTRQFAFTVTLTGADGQPLAGPFAYTGDPAAGPADGSLTLDAGVGAFTLGHGQSITLLDVPADCSVRIAEAADARYATSIWDSEDAVVPDPADPGDTGVFGMTSDPRTIAFTNTRMVPPPTGVSLGGDGLVLLGALGPLLMLGLYGGRALAFRGVIRRGRARCFV